MTAPAITRTTRYPDTPDRSWRLDGNCATSSINMHPDDGDHTGEQAAKKVCASCPVAAHCLAESIALRDWHGIRAALTGPERRNLASQRQARRCARCHDLFVPRLTTQIRCRPCARTNDTRSRRRNRR
ncbi:WhiB family transcriptional regulator [Micromonospora sp. RTGN7]|uniref:WhiB family transcriptional regulator n=1 Tax=Micromonospora sp. RTGN7 TaxID=3016526 RepID=UPI0029FEEDC6|nr:WhiB family transcriptional regulator [Micromonospora sp. RTGN7]